MTSLSFICTMLFKILLRINGLPLEFTITHPEDKLISAEGVSLSHVNYLQFDAKGSSDVTISFHDDQFHIIIGGWYTTLSAMYLGEFVYPPADEYRGSLLNALEYKQFWISWNSFQVYIGLGNVRGIDVILFGQQQCPLKVLDATFGANFGGTLEYRVNQADMIGGNGRFCGQDTSCDIVSIIVFVESMSMIECAIICKITTGCTFFVFNINSHQCKLFEKDVGSNILVSEKVYWEC
ncbi:uncharacterized protein LOC134698153 [Mytilus trossulus]|uniref:uncharacterized protein LOC134698153 n=1 Tax=Mytilus trossulus TaxID=6551 RepID=UPI0030074D7D